MHSRPRFRSATNFGSARSVFNKRSEPESPKPRRAASLRQVTFANNASSEPERAEPKSREKPPASPKTKTKSSSRVKEVSSPKRSPKKSKGKIASPKKNKKKSSTANGYADLDEDRSSRAQQYHQLQNAIEDVDSEIERERQSLKKQGKRLKKRNIAATMIQAMVRGYIVFRKWYIPRLEKRLFEIELRKEKELIALREEFDTKKEKIRTKAEARARANRLRKSKVGENSEWIDHLRKENAEIRKHNQQLHKNCSNLRTNNKRLEETIKNGDDYHKQLKIHHSRVSSDNQKLAKFDSNYQSKVEELSDTLESRTAWARYEHKIKRAYARAIFCAVEMVRDTEDKKLLENVEEMTALLEGHTQTWGISPFDDYRPKPFALRGGEAGGKTKGKKATKYDSDSDSDDSEVSEVLKRTKSTTPKSPKGSPQGRGSRKLSSPKGRKQRGKSYLKSDSEGSDSSDSEDGKIITRRVGGSQPSPEAKKPPKAAALKAYVTLSDSDDSDSDSDDSDSS